MQTVLCGGDPTWGIAGEVGRLLKVSPLELEGPEAAGLETDVAGAYVDGWFGFLLHSR